MVGSMSTPGTQPTTRRYPTRPRVGIWGGLRFRMPAVEAEDVEAILSTGLLGRLGTNCPDGKDSVTIPRLAAGVGESGISAAREWIATCRQNHSR